MFPLSSFSTDKTLFLFILLFLKTLDIPVFGLFIIPNKICSTETYSSCIFLASSSADTKALSTSLDTYTLSGSLPEPVTAGKDFIAF